MGILRQISALGRKLALGISGQFLGAQHHSSAGRFQQPRQHLQQSGFAGAIGTQHGDEFSGIGLEGDIAENGLAAALYRDVFRRQQSHGATLRMRATSQKKKGVPNRLVKTPSRNSGLVWTNRAAMSAHSKSTAPVSAAGSSTRRGS